MESNRNPPDPTFGPVPGAETPFGRQAREQEARVAREAEEAARNRRAERDGENAANDAIVKREAAAVERERLANVDAEQRRIEAAAERKDAAAAVKAEHDRVKIYMLTPRDPAEPPFHFTGTASHYVVAARSVAEARKIAGGAAGDQAAAWRDHKLSKCTELKPDKPGLIARDMGA